MNSYAQIVKVHGTLMQHEERCGKGAKDTKVMTCIKVIDYIKPSIVLALGATSTCVMYSRPRPQISRHGPPYTILNYTSAS